MNTINIATTSTRYREDAQLLVIRVGEYNQGKRRPVSYLKRTDFIDQFEAGDVIVANSAATLPASFMGTRCSSGEVLELRLAQNLNDDFNNYAYWKGVILGKGDWHLPTEERIDIPELKAGETLCFGHDLQAEILTISADNRRFIELRFLSSPDQLLHQIYRAGRLIQYSYHEDQLDLWDGQTIFAGKPIALEAPSASFLLTWEMVLTLKKRGVEVVSLLHAAGISSTGEEALDTLLPLPEYYEIPEATADAVNRAKQNDRRIIALGTSVTRALESATDEDGDVQAGSGVTTLLLSPTYERKVVDGLITGMHEDGTSHLQLLQSFAPWNLIEKTYDRAKKLGYLWHEYGDSCLIFA